jgi:AraC family transcriptional regulator of adaptative response/methylated-DNA-[protein]-cysteine methyltransferase
MIISDEERVPMQAKLHDYHQYSQDYQVVEQALVYLEHNYRTQPSLDEVAASVGYSPYHFQRLFARWVGISPKRFTQFLTKEHARHLLESSSTLLDISYQAGMSGPGRLHDLFVSCEAVTPGEYRSRGAGLSIDYGFHDTPFGECLLAATERGVCGLYFVIGQDRAATFEQFSGQWNRASLSESAAKTAPLIGQIFPIQSGDTLKALHLYLQGTNFQIKVWEALLRIPSGQVLAYNDLANMIGKPGSARAVSRALAVNPIAVLIPCHRVIRKMGAFGGYRWGTARKKAILGWEMARSSA